MWDAENMFSNDQKLASGASAHIVDVRTREIGRGQPILLNVIASGGASGELSVAVLSSDAEDMAGADTLVTYLVPSDRMARGGSVLAAALPTGCRRYLRLSYSGATGGSITAGLVQGAETSQF